MDAFTQLSLVAKAKRVFESETTFLSFPALAPITCEPEDLSFAGPGEMTPHVLAAMSGFAHITNAIPRGAIAPQEEDEYLWDVYGDVLESAQVADGDMSPADAARYEQATNVLHTRSPDGLLSDSDVLKRYQQYRDAHIAALERFKNLQCTAEASEDAAARARWRDEEEPRLRREIQHLEGQWRTEGLKAAVEEAQQVEQACAARAPARVWDAWKTSFVDSLVTEADTNLVNCAITGFAPYDCLDGDAWPRFTLTRAEMNRFAAEAPRELVDVLGSSADENIQRFSFEYRSVAVTRPWFQPALFTSRNWRLREGDEPLSEGTDLSRGRCPAYVTAIVFARNANVERTPQARPAPPGPRVNPRGIRPLVRDHRDHAPGPRVVIRARPGGRDRPRPIVRPRPTGTRRPPSQVHRGGFRTIRRRDQERAIQPSAAPAVPAAPVTAPSSELTILAYICKRVARCPDPDPALRWP